MLKKKKKKSKTVQIKGICPHCKESIIINLVKPDDLTNLTDIEFIDIKNSKEFATTLKSNSNPGVSKDMMPNNGECPKCQEIIFFNDIAGITIIDIVLEKN